MAPENIERSGPREHYPVIVTGEGDWSVTTTIGLSAGAMSDRDALSIQGESSTAASQFTITGNGGEWRSATVTHRIRRNGQVTVRESRVPVRDAKAPTMKEK